MTLTYIFQHLLSPEQYSPPKKMLEFSRKQQEDTIVKEIEDDVKQLTQDEADLEVYVYFIIPHPAYEVWVQCVYCFEVVHPSRTFLFPLNILGKLMDFDQILHMH